MTHSSLFSGIGGFDLASHWAGIDNIFACEIDEFCRKVLVKRFPNTILFNDIKETNFAQFNGRVDIISGGFPCQPFSVAGKRAGTEDNRYLWGEMLRVVREVTPKWVIAENVRGLATIENGHTFETVCNDLEVSGYSVQPFIIPALSVGAPHKRERLWIIARNLTNSDSRRLERTEKERREGEYALRSDSGITPNTTNFLCKGWDGGRSGKNCDNGEQLFCENEPSNGNEIWSKTNSINESDIANTDNGCRNENEIQARREIDNVCNTGKWNEHWTEAIARIYGMDDGLSRGMDRLNERYKSRQRKSRIKAMGNAIVPQIAYQIFMTIMEIENGNT